MNSNVWHNLLNLLIALVGSLAAYDWTGFGFTPEIAGMIVAGLGVVKLLINAVRDGIGGMVKTQPPVK